MTDPLTWRLVNTIATDLGAGESARMKWRQAGRGVPPVWQLKITRELMARGILVSLDGFARLQARPGRVAA